jgi:hypothetical protein
MITNNSAIIAKGTLGRQREEKNELYPVYLLYFISLALSIDNT